MKRTVFFSLFSLFLINSAYSQLMVAKRIGKNAGNSKLGYGTFTYYDFPLADYENRSIRIEIIDLAFFPEVNPNIYNPIGYVSIKAGYKHGFGETLTGFYVEPQAGWVRVVASNPGVHYADGLALALETGYTLAVGQRDNSFNFGLKYETDLAGADYTCSSIGFRVSYSFHLFRRKDDY